MKIAYYTTTILEHGGGLEKYFIESAHHISKLSGINADVITMDDHFTNKIVKMLEIFYLKKINKKQIYKERLEDIDKRLKPARYFKIHTMDSLKKILNNYDIVYSKNEILEAFILKFLIGYKNLPPVIFGCHTSTYYPTAVSIQSKLHNYLYSSFIYKFLTNGVKAFHVTNSSDEKNLRKLLPKKKVVKIYNPLHVNELSMLNRTHIYNFNWDGSKYNLLWINRLIEQKGVPELLWIIDFINNTKYRDKIVFNIIGDGDSNLSHEIIALKKKWGNINFFGYVQYKYLPSIYSRNNLFINTSRWEGFGLSLLEAQAFGMPAISFNIPGSQDIIKDKKTGFLVHGKTDFANKIIDMVKGNIKLNKTYIKKTAQSNFEEKMIYSRLVNFFAQVLNDNTDSIK